MVTGLFPFFLIAGAVLNRFRGGMWPTGHTQLTRSIWAAGMSALVFAAAGDWRPAVIGFPLWFLGALSPHGAWMNVRDLGEVGFGSACGVLTVLLASLALMFFLHNPVPLLLAGLLQGPLYFVGWRLPTLTKDFAKGTGWGEALFGAAMGAGISLAATEPPFAVKVLAAGVIAAIRGHIGN